MIERFCRTQLPTLIDLVGTNRFLPELLYATNRSITRIDVCALFRYDGAAQPVGSWTVGDGSGEAARLSAQRYVAGLGVHDPMLRHLSGLRSGSEPITFHLRPDQIEDPRYRELNFTRTSTAERVSVLCRDELSFYSVNFYRLCATGSFETSERLALMELAPLLSSFALKHASLLGLSRHASLQAVRERERIRRKLIDRSARLSDRELETCTLITLGHTSESIALTLDISVNTVLTFRKRAYMKLGISAQSELFRICLG